MSQYASKSVSPVKPQETVLAWLIKIFTGPLLVILLLIHLVVNHYTGSRAGLMSYADVIAYFSNPIIPIMEAIFLITVVTHSLLGLRSIILDLHPSPKIMGMINLVLVVIGVVSVGYGIWLAMTIAAMAG